MASPRLLPAEDPLWDVAAVSAEINMIVEYSWPVVFSMTLYQLQIVSLLAAVEGDAAAAGDAAKSDALLGGIGLAVMAINGSGYYWIMGLSSAVETLTAQLYGQGRLIAMGMVLKTAVFVLGILAVPVAFILWNLQPVLELAGVQEAQCQVAGRFARVMIAGLPGMVLMECLRKHVQAQGITRPFLLITVIVLVLHLLLLKVFVKVLGWGVEGAAAAWALSFWNNAWLTIVYMLWSGMWSQAGLNRGWDPDCVKGISVFLGLALPGAGMLFLEVLCFELNTLFAGMLGPVELATQTILTNTESCFFMIPLGISVACAARVGQLLGRGRPVAANRAVRISLGISCFLVVVMIICFLMVQDIWVKQFTVNPAVKTIFPLILPVQILVFFLNAIQGVLSGAIRGCGRQSQGFLYNILAFWVVALPWAMCFTFLWGWGLFGLWNGINMGLSLQVLAMLLFFSRLDWSEEARKALARGEQMPQPKDLERN